MQTPATSERHGVIAMAGAFLMLAGTAMLTVFAIVIVGIMSGWIS